MLPGCSPAGTESERRRCCRSSPTASGTPPDCPGPPNPGIGPQRPKPTRVASSRVRHLAEWIRINLAVCQVDGRAPAKNSLEDAFGLELRELFQGAPPQGMLLHSGGFSLAAPTTDRSLASACCWRAVLCSSQGATVAKRIDQSPGRVQKTLLAEYPPLRHGRPVRMHRELPSLTSGMASLLLVRQTWSWYDSRY